MRAYFVLTAVLFAVTPVLARPVAVPKHLAPNHVLLDLRGVHLFHEPSAPPAGFSKWDEHIAESHQAPSFSRLGSGSLHAEFGLDDNPRANLEPYKMQGADQLGSSIWQEERGKSAKLMFTWPPQK